MALTNAEKQKRWRERQKEKNNEAYKQMERERKRKTYVPIQNLPAEKQTIERRKGQAKYKRKCKKKEEIKRQQEELLAEPSTSGSTRTRANSEKDKLVVKLSLSRKDKKSRKGKHIKKKYDSALKRAHRDIEKLANRNEVLKKQKKALQRRLQRNQRSESKKADETRADMGTPRSKTKLLLRKAGVRVSQKSGVYRQLLLGITATRDLKKSVQRKKAMSSTQKMGLELVKKYRCLNYLSKEICMGRNRLANLHVKRASRSTKEKYGKQVVDFLERDDNSTMMPGKRDTKRTDTGTAQKRILNDYLHNLYDKFRLEYPSVKLSKTTFLRLRPKHIMYSCFASRKTCLCTYHQNFALKLKAMKGMGLKVSVSPDVFVKTYTTNDQVKELMVEQITDPNVKYKHWKKVQDNDKYRWKEIEETVSKEDFVDKVLKELSEFRNHVERVQTQYREIRRLRENLPENEILLWMDFAENYNCTSMEEVQSAYWNSEMVSLHTMVAYLPGGKVQSFVAASNSLQHNASAVYCILLKVIPLLREILPVLTKIHYLTDSPTSQYRDRTIFKLVCDHEKEFNGIKAQWNYLEVGHGKGPCDGLGASVKRAADMAVKQNKCSIQCAEDFHKWSLENNSTKVRYISYSESDIEEAKEKLNSKEPAIAVPGTMKIHAVARATETSILTRNMSCYCENCVKDINTTKCSGWESHTVVKTKPNKEPQTVRAEDGEPKGSGHEVIMSTDCMPEVINDESVPTTTTNEEKDETMSIKVDNLDWIAVMYESDWYIGQVTDIDENELFINFLTAAGKFKDSYKFPNRPDQIWIWKSDVIMKIKTLAAVGKSKRLYKIDGDEKQMIQDLFQKRIV